MVLPNVLTELLQSRSAHILVSNNQSLLDRIGRRNQLPNGMTELLQSRSMAKKEIFSFQVITFPAPRPYIRSTFHSEIERGRVGLGNYRLCAGLEPQPISASTSPSVVFDDIVENVRTGSAARSQLPSSSTSTANPSSASSSASSPLSSSSQQLSSDVEPDDIVPPPGIISSNGTRASECYNC